MRALVTGGAGFIGSNLVDGLIDHGYAVTVLDDLSTGREDNLVDAVRRGAAIVHGDVTAAGTMVDVTTSVRPDVVFHLAAQIDVRRSVDAPAHDASVNVGGTIAVLDAAARVGRPRVVNVSTGGAIYGDAAIIPTPESTPESPLAAYGVSKLAAELYCGWFARHHGLTTVTLRLANVYGPRQDPLGEAGVIAIFCERATSGRPATVYGDGTQTRDFVYVADVVDAAVRAATADLAPGEVVNVGSGRETTVLELADLVARATGHPLEIERAPARAGEVVRSLLEDSRGHTLLDRAAPTDLLTGLRLTLEWLTGRAPTDGPCEVRDQPADRSREPKIPE